MSDCIFCKIAKGEIPSKKLYEDDEVIAFHDIRPIAPVHFLLMPRLHVESLNECSEVHAALLAKMLLLGSRLAKEQGLGTGFRTMINTGTGGGQEVFHLHFHIFGGSAALPKT
ncbi:MAG TPA: histidine triad nucleotide-binding protein [Novimethylophilus sp.]|jgi:histidine triad (HIT) family protein|uniref:histidine triad nucleotide-binding protein n=1 Tax=Novimethylophilus sp. TaxID=2137426 RepID=UPI002F42C02A